jgi:ABC-type multidrug transport system fused ATPase/permease subunit
MNKIYKIFLKNKYNLLLIYLFMLLSEISILSQPFLLGRSIDGLIEGKWTWILFLGISFFLSNLFNYKRMVYDTKVYTKIYNDIIFKFLENKKIDNSTKVARTDMARDIVGVLIYFY